MNARRYVAARGSDDAGRLRRVDARVWDALLAAGLSAYRIVQEALTDALKHSGTAHVRVHVFGGPLETGARDGGGFVVHTHLPSPTPDASP